MTGWGGTAPSRAWAARATRPEDVEAVFDQLPPRGLIARGLGRSYGDAAQNAGGVVLETVMLDGIRDIDLSRGLVTVDGGISLDTLLRRLLPLGWFIPVSPGTRYVTVGGAIAADIHGKNHHVDGSFCEHVERFTLRTPEAAVEVNPDAEPDLFWATAGGMGLTGVILDATVRLLKVETAWMSVDTERATDLDDALARMTEGDHGYRYSVAWIDCLARGRALGRSVLMRGDHATREELSDGDRSGVACGFSPPRVLSAPPGLPSGLLSTPALRAFNEVYFRRSPRREHGRLESLHSYFHPLDIVGDWNRLYGPRGLLQYQLVVPFGAEDTLRTVVERLAGERAPAFLAVLKRFGGGRGMLSFPIPGWTLTMDLPAGRSELAPFLDGLDELVVGAGGRLYLAKDSRLRPELLEAMYPELGRWREVQGGLDPHGTLRSDLGRRLGLGGGSKL